MEQIVQIIKANTNFVLHGHVSPDGDAIGSCHGLAFALQKLGKKVAVMMDEYPQKFNIIPGQEFYCKDIDFEVEVFIALDCADTMRLGSGLSLFNAARHTICIDHHASNKGFAHVNYIESHTSSTSEIVFNLVKKLTPLTKDMAAALYAGIICDTGGFKFSATSPATMHAAGELMATGIDFTNIYNRLMFMRTLPAAKAMAIVMQNAVVTEDGHVIYSHITTQMLQDVDATSKDLEGVIEHLLCTNDVLIAVFVCEKGDGKHSKISLRAHRHDVGGVAVKLGGGGHRLAAGATVADTVSVTLANALALVNNLLVGTSI